MVFNAAQNNTAQCSRSEVKYSKFRWIQKEMETKTECFSVKHGWILVCVVWVLKCQCVVWESERSSRPLDTIIWCVPQGISSSGARITVHISRGTQHPPSRYVKWQEPWQSKQKLLSPRLFRLLLSTHWLHTSLGRQHWHQGSAQSREVLYVSGSVSQLKLDPSSLASLFNNPTWLSREASECLRALLCCVTCISFLCRFPIDRPCAWRNRILNRKRYGCRANQSGIHPCNWTLLETEFREWMPGQSLLLVNVTLHTSHTLFGPGSICFVYAQN